MVVCFLREKYFQKKFDGIAFLLILAFAALASWAGPFLEAEGDRSMPIWELWLLTCGFARGLAAVGFYFPHEEQARWKRDK